MNYAQKKVILNKIAELKKLKEGCGNKVDNYGDCWHVVSKDAKYCNKCKRRIFVITNILNGVDKK